MDAAQLARYRQIDTTPHVSVDDLSGPDRTLTLGYDVDSAGYVHVFLLAGQINVVQYDHTMRVTDHDSATSFPVTDLRPSKRSFPERTDFDFAVLMAQRDARLSFTTFDEAAFEAGKDKSFHGPIG